MCLHKTKTRMIKKKKNNIKSILPSVFLLLFLNFNITTWDCLCLCDCVTCVRANTVYIVELIHLLLLFTCVTENTSHVLLIHYSPRVRHISIITVTHSGLDRRHPLLPQHLNGEKNRAEPPNLPGRWLAGWLAGRSCLFLSTNNVLSAHTLQAHASHIGLRSLSGCWLIIVFRARVLLTEESGDWRDGMLMLMRRRRRRRYRYNNSVYISPLYRHQVTTHHHCNQSLLF